MSLEESIKIFPKAIFRKGYYFLPLAHPMEEKIYDMYDKKEILCRLSYDPRAKTCQVTDFKSYGYVMNVELHQMNEKEIEEMKEQIRDYIRWDFKIHLQPKSEYLLQVLVTLRDHLSKLPIRLWKVLGTPIESIATAIEKKRFPIIVLYPVIHSETELLSLLETLCKLFPNSEELGLNITPRYNKKLNSLLYIAGGDGDIKEEVNYRNFFTEDTIFYKEQKELAPRISCAP